MFFEMLLKPIQALPLLSILTLTSSTLQATISTDYGTNALGRSGAKSHIFEAPHYYSEQTHEFAQHYRDNKKAQKAAPEQSAKKSRKERLQDNARKRA